MVTAYYFTGFNFFEQIKVVFTDREHIFLASSKTGYNLTDVSEKFYDTPAEKAMMLDLPEDSFDYHVKLSFARQGYKFVKKENE